MITTERKKIKVLYELRPISAGYAGIPYVTRTVFEMLHAINEIEVDGLLNTNTETLTNLNKLDVLKYHQANFLKLTQQSTDKFSTIFPKIIKFLFSSFVNFAYFRIIISNFFPLKIFDFQLINNSYIWQHYFSKSLKADSPLTNILKFKVIAFPRFISSFIKNFLFINTKINTSEYDYFITHTPPPYKVSDNTKLIIIYYDSIPLTHSATVKKGNFFRRYWHHSITEHIKKNTIFICISNDVKKKLIQLYPKLNEKNIKVIYLHVQNLYKKDLARLQIGELANVIKNYNGINILKKESNFTRIEEAHLLEENTIKNLDEHVKYCLSIGSLEPRKNIINLVKIFSEFIISNNIKNLKLILIGDIGWLSKQDYDFIYSQQVLGNIYYLTAVPMNIMAKIIHNCSSYISLSVEEGHNLPLTQVTYFNKYIIASNIGVHQEILSDYKRKLLVDLNNKKEIFSAFKVVIDQDQINQDQLPKHSNSDLQNYSYDVIKNQWKEVLANQN